MNLSEPTRLVLVRHGVTAWNRELRIQGQLDTPLSPTGILQAQRAAQALVQEGLQHIYSSDLQRAHSTAQAIALATSTPLTTHSGLRERGFGQYEGLTHAEIEQRWPTDAQRWRQREPGFNPGGGEPLEVFYERCVQCAATLAARHPGQAVALVAHGGVLDCLYRAATGQALYARRTWELGNATINRLIWHGEGFSLVGWNDAAHLENLPPHGMTALGPAHRSTYAWTRAADNVRCAELAQFDTPYRPATCAAPRGDAPCSKNYFCF